MYPDLSAGIDYGQVIAWVFYEPFLLNSSCHYFEKVDEGRKMSSQLWLRMAGYLNYISYRYVFMYYFVSLTKYAGRKLNNLMWLRMAGEFMSIYLFGYDLSSQLWLCMVGYRNYLSSTYVFISSFVSLTKYAGRKLNTLMWLRMAGEFMSTYFFAYAYLANVSSLDCG